MGAAVAQAGAVSAGGLSLPSVLVLFSLSSNFSPKSSSRAIETMSFQPKGTLHLTFKLLLVDSQRCLKFLVNFGMKAYMVEFASIDSNFLRASTLSTNLGVASSAVRDMP